MKSTLCGDNYSDDIVDTILIVPDYKNGALSMVEIWMIHSY